MNSINVLTGIVLIILSVEATLAMSLPEQQTCNNYMDTGLDPETFGYVATFYPTTNYTEYMFDLCLDETTLLESYCVNETSGVYVEIHCSYGCMVGEHYCQTTTTTTTTTTTSSTTTTIQQPAEISLTRELPTTATPGSTVEVFLNLSLGTNSPSAVIIYEYIPSLNLISTDPQTNNTNSTQIKWVLINSEMLDRTDLYNRTLSYVVEISNETGNLTFNGEIFYIWNDEDITESILGDTQLAVTSVKGDLDGNGIVSDFELLSYIDSWVQSQVSDFDLLEAIDNWSG